MNATPVTVAGKAGRRLVLHFDLNKTIIMKDPSMNLHNSTLTVRFFKTYNNTGCKYSCWSCLGKNGIQETWRRASMDLCNRLTFRDQASNRRCR